MEEKKKTAAAPKAAAPKTTAVKEAVKDTVKKAEAVAAPAAKAVKEETAVAAAKVKEETTKAAAKAKTAAKKASKPAAKKAAGRKTSVTSTVSVQFSGKSYTTEELVAIAKDVWKFDLKQKVSDFKNVELYVKPEENLAYYVINGEYTGSFFI